MVTAEQAAAANLAWRAVNAPQTIQASEQQQAEQYRQHYYTVEQPAQQARDLAVQQTIAANRQMINRQEGLEYGGTHTLPQLAALYGSAEKGRQAYEAEHEYYEAHPSAEFLAISGQYAASRNRIVTSGGSYAATGELELTPITGPETFSGRADEYKSAWEREVYGVGAPDNEREYYRRQAEAAAVQRPGFTAPSELGDIRTQQIRAGYGAFSQAIGLVGGEVASDYQMTGRLLEIQRQAAYATPTRRDERFFMGELQKWAQIPIEKSAAYHDIGMESGEQIPANPFEYQADLAVEFLKGSPNKASERFSPVSGEMSKHLPAGEGVQEFAWREAITDYKRQNVDARTPYPEQVSFMEGVTYLGAAEGKYGPYGKLYGGIDTGGVSIVTPPQAAVVSAEAIVSGGAQTKAQQPDFLAQQRSQLVGFANVILPGATGLLPSVKAEQSEAALEFNAAVASGDFGGAYGAAEKYFFATSPTRAMPDITPIGTEINIKESREASDVFTFGATAAKQVYTSVRENPLQDVALVALPGAWKIGEEAIVGRGVATAAMSKVPVVSTAGRALSTPLATDIGKYGIKGGLAGLYAFESGKSILEAEGPVAKGKAAGTVAYQVGGMTLGVPLAGAISIRAPVNEYAGRKFFSGKLGMSPVESTVFKAETTARSFITANRGAYLDVSTIARMGRFEEPMVRATPAIEETSVAGPYAKSIRAVLGEQKHAMIGSSTVRQQYPTAIAEKYGLRTGKDVDVLFQSPQKAIASLSGRTGLSEEAAKGVMDVHPIPQGYPRLKPSTEVMIESDESSFASRLFGDPYRNIARPRSAPEVITGKSYGGAETYEAIQVQYGRKSAAVAAVIESPITKGYRAEKDIYDFIGLYKAQREAAISRGASPEMFKKTDIAMERFMGREITIGTVKGQKIGDISPTRKVKVSQLYEEGRLSAMEAPAPRYESRIGYIERARAGSIFPSGGIASILSPAPSPIASMASSSARSSPSAVSPASIRSPASPSRFGSSFIPKSPSVEFRSYTPPSSTRGPSTGVPGSPPSMPGTPSYTPPWSPPSVPPTTPPSVPPTTPPSGPPSTPPSVPPSTPPYNPPPPVPPTKIPFGGMLPGGGGGRGPGGNLGVIRWQRENLVATQEYLSRGMRDIGFGFGKGTGSYIEKFVGAKKRKKSKRRKK